MYKIQKYASLKRGSVLRNVDMVLYQTEDKVDMKTISTWSYMILRIRNCIIVYYTVAYYRQLQHGLYTVANYVYRQFQHGLYTVVFYRQFQHGLVYCSIL